jgi:hypothetical protein
MQKFRANKEEWNDLARIVAERVSGIAKHVGPDPSQDLRDSLENLNRCAHICSYSMSPNIDPRLLEQITEEVQRMQSRNRVTRALSVQADKEKIASFHARMKNELDTLSVGVYISYGLLAHP